MSVAVRELLKSDTHLSLSLPPLPPPQGGRSTNRKYVETGTQAKGDVDYQWIPEGATTTASKNLASFPGAWWPGNETRVVLAERIV